MLLFHGKFTNSKFEISRTLELTSFSAVLTQGNNHNEHFGYLFRPRDEDYDDIVLEKNAAVTAKSAAVKVCQQPGSR